MRPLTTMLPRNAAPTRTLIVADPSKLNYFHQAALTRAGAGHTWGALQGLGEVTQDMATASTVKTPGALQTVADFGSALLKGLLGGSTPPPMQTTVVREDASPVPYIVGFAALGLAGFAVYKVMKR